MRTAIVCGSGPDFFKDLATAQALAPDAELIGVNFTGLWLPRAWHLVSLHVGTPDAVRRLRAEADWNKQGKTPPVTWSIVAYEGIDRVWRSDAGIAGTSSLYAVRVALEPLAYERVILAGVPMDGSGRFFDPPGTPHVWNHVADRGPWEIAARLEFHDRVRSVSGWTAELLGEP